MLTASIHSSIILIPLSASAILASYSACSSDLFLAKVANEASVSSINLSESAMDLFNDSTVGYKFSLKLSYDLV